MRGNNFRLVGRPDEIRVVRTLFTGWGVTIPAGGFGSAWTPIGAEATASGYEVVFKNGSLDQYTVWATDSNGNYLSSIVGTVSGTDNALVSLEPGFQQDLNGDGKINPSPFVINVTFDAADEEFQRHWDVLRMVLEDVPQKVTRQDILDEWPADFAKPNSATLWRWLKRAFALGAKEEIRQRALHDADLEPLWLEIKVL